jgi:hypothetical protein
MAPLRTPMTEEMEVHLHSFLTWTLGGNQWAAAHLVALSPVEGPLVLSC